MITIGIRSNERLWIKDMFLLSISLVESSEW